MGWVRDGLEQANGGEVAILDRYRGRIRSWSVFLEFIASVRLRKLLHCSLYTAWRLSIWQQKWNREIFRRLLKKMVVMSERVRSDDTFREFSDG